MRKLLIVIAALACFAVVILSSSCSGKAVSGGRQAVATNSAFTVAQDVPKESKVQPKEIVLSKDSQSDKYGEVPFNHENHALKSYSVDGKSVLACVECHHTDQPVAGLKSPLKTGEREVALTAAVLAAADSKPVKSCRACHLQAGDDSAPMPTITYPDKPTPTKLNNEVAYHLNCNLCHDKAIAARPDLKAKKVAGSNDCLPCHKPAV